MAPCTARWRPATSCATRTPRTSSCSLLRCSRAVWRRWRRSRCAPTAWWCPGPATGTCTWAVPTSRAPSTQSPTVTPASISPWNPLRLGCRCGSCCTRAVWSGRRSASTMRPGAASASSTSPRSTAILNPLGTAFSRQGTGPAVTPPWTAWRRTPCPCSSTSTSPPSCPSPTSLTLQSSLSTSTRMSCRQPMPMPSMSFRQPLRRRRLWKGPADCTR
mmetsp:Transcript_3023/g.8822  ORF Transcript_3023/g.8822 Transcript_3023/m.8822 type:complete len:217 (+) Transcript_3023:929-1579(+)